MNREIAHNEKFLELFLVNFLCNVGVRIQHYLRFESVADQFFLACALDRLPDYAAQSQKLGHLIDRSPASILWVRKFLCMN